MAFVILGCSAKEKAESKASSLPYYKEATFTPHWLTPDSPELKDFHRIPAFSLINQDDDTITEKTMEGKIYITNFFFSSCPGICPKMTNNMALLQEAFIEDDQVLLLSHSVTPEYDSVAVLKDYATAKNIVSGKWHLLTGDRDEIYRLGRHSYFVEEDLGIEKSTDDFLHTENIILVDQNRHIRGIYNGLNKVAIAQLIEDVKVLQGK